MPRFQKKFNALEAANILTNFDEDFDASFLSGVASKLGVSEAVSLHASPDAASLSMDPIGNHDDNADFPSTPIGNHDDNADSPSTPLGNHDYNDDSPSTPIGVLDDALLLHSKCK